MNPGLRSIFLTGAALLALAPTLLPAQGGSSADRVRLEAVASRDALRPGDRVDLALVVKVSPGWHINTNEPGVEGLVATRVSTDPLPEGVALADWSFPEGERLEFQFSPDPLNVYEGKVVLRSVLTAGDSLKGEEVLLRGSLRVQACNDRLCLRPGEAPFRLALPVGAAGAEVARVRPRLFEGVETAAPAAASVEPSSGDPGDEVAAIIEEYGPLLAFGVFFGWGLVLCLTPCVFPMIPITAGYFANQAGGSRGKALLLAVLYGQGLALVYGILGTVAGVTGQMLGALLQEPAVLLGVAVVLVVLSLSMFGLYEFKIPGMGAGAQGRSGFLGAFLMGAFLGIVAAPCIGPFSVALLTYVGQRGEPLFGFWAFFVLAQGLALPFMVLAVFTELTLPSGGEWMVWVKKVFGVMILGLALYFLAPLLPEGWAAWAFLVFAILGAIYLAFLERTGMHMPRFRAVKTVTGLVIIAGAVLFFASFQRIESPLEWQDFDLSSLEADGSRGQPVMVDFYADWCIPCKELEHRTFTDPRVAEVLDDFSLYKANLTTRSQRTREWTERFRVVGVPTLVFFDAEGRERLRIQEFIPADEFLARLRRARMVQEAELQAGAR